MEDITKEQATEIESRAESSLQRASDFRDQAFQMQVEYQIYRARLFSMRRCMQTFRLQASHRTHCLDRRLVEHIRFLADGIVHASRSCRRSELDATVLYERLERSHPRTLDPDLEEGCK